MRIRQMLANFENFDEMLSKKGVFGKILSKVGCEWPKWVIEKTKQKQKQKTKQTQTQKTNKTKQLKQKNKNEKQRVKASWEK